MPNPTVSIGFSPTIPAPDTGYQNAIPRGDNGQPLTRESFEVPNTGKVSAKTANYTAAAADCGKLLSFNSASAVVLTLPAVPPSVGAGQWQVQVQNVGAGSLTVALTITSPITSLLDGSSTSLVLSPGSGMALFTDGTNYFTERGIAVIPSGAANLVFATPDGSSGTASLRALVAADIPSLPESKITNLVTDLAAKVPTTRTVNGHALSSNVVVSASDLTTGTLPHAQLPTLLAADIPVMVASGASHAPGAVPDPGASAGTTKYLREDATFAVPPGTSASLSVTTKGDLQGFSTVAARIPVGSDGQVLTADSTQTLGVKYVTPSAPASVYFGQGEATAATSQNTITLGSTPLAGSISLFVNGVFTAPSAYAVSGTTVSLNSGSFGSSADVVCMWATANSTPGGISLGGGVLRGSTVGSSTSSGMTIALPAAAISGDLAFLFVGSQNAVNTPTGWTVQASAGGSNWAQGAIFSKLLNSTDIATGSVSITTAGSGGMVSILAACHGNPGTVREIDPFYGGGGTTPATQGTTSTGAVLATDFALLFGSARASVIPTCNIGSLQQGATTGSAAAAALYLYQPAGGVFTATFSYSGYNTTGVYQAMVIVT